MAGGGRQQVPWEGQKLSLSKEKEEEKEEEEAAA